MKKLLSLLLTIIMIFGSFAGMLNVIATADSEKFDESDFIYIIENSNAIITGIANKDYTGQIDIPEALGGYPVTEIGKEAFRGSLCTSVNIPPSVTEIHPEAFAYDMPNIEAYYTNSNANSSNSKYFSNNGILYESIYGYHMIFAYPKNSKQQSFKLDTGYLAGVCAFAFSEVKNLKEFSLVNYQFSAVDNYAFYGAVELEKVTIDKCLYLGDKAFANCEKLTDIELGTMMIVIGTDAFENTPLTNDLSNYDSDGVLYYNNYLITSLPEYDREYYEIKDGTSTVASGAFDWDSLEEVYIPGSAAINSNPFYRCANIKNFIVNSNSTFIVDEYGVLMNNSTVVSYPNGRFQTCYVLESNITEVAPYAFYNSPVQNFYVSAEVELGNYSLGNNNVTDIHYQGDMGNWLSRNHIDPGYMNIPNAADSATVHYGTYSEEAHSILTKTDTKATCSCGYETEIAPANDEYSENGFTYRIVDGRAEIVNCPSFITGDLVIPETIGGFIVTSIASNAFDLCKCTGVFIPSTVEIIDKSSGLWDINKLTKINVASANANFSSYNGVLYNKDLSVLLLYPDAKSDAEFTVPISVETIVSKAFAGNYYIKTVSIIENLKTIEAYAFQGCTKLETLKILTDVDYIGDYAFRYCYSLANVTLRNSIGYIGRDVFRFSYLAENDASYTAQGLLIRDGCIVAAKETSVDKFAIPEGTTVIAAGIFSWSNVKEVVIPSSVVSVGEGAFNSCEKLEKITVFSDSRYLSTDEYGALYDYNKTKLIAYPPANKQACFFVPDGVKEIMPYALNFDGMLSNKYIPLSVTKIGKNGLGENPDMIINYQGGIADWSKIDFAGNEGYKSFINSVEKNYFAQSTGVHHNSEVTATDPTCTEKGTETITCVCGYQHINTTPKNGHKATGNRVVTTPAACTQREISVRYCSVCGEVAEIYQGSALGHKYVKTEQDVTCDQPGGIFYECSRCGDSYSENYVEAHGHTATNKTVNINPTCSEDGGWYKKCDTCGEAFGEPIEVYAATGHTEGEWTVETEASCDEDGRKILPCTICGETIDFRVIEKSHDYKETVIEQTCTYKKTRFRCSKCGDEYYSDKYFVDTSHGELEEVIEEPGCFTTGKKYNRCTVCGATVGTVETINSAGHQYTVIDSKEATCSEEGYEKKQCSKCSHTKTTTQPKIAHTVGSWEYESGYTFSGICSVCNTSFESIKVFISLDKTSIQTFSGIEEKLVVSVTENLFDNIVFTSSDKNVATVDSDGIVKAVAPGKATITAKIYGTDISATCSVTVFAKAYLVNWMVGEDVYVVTSVKEGESITPPAPPEMEGFEFSGWLPDIPEIMPSHGLIFTAKFNSVAKSDKYDVSASYEEGCFDEDITLDVNEIETDREPGGVYMVEGEYYDQIGLYNIKAVNAESETVQPNDGYKVTIRLALPEAYKARNSFVIYHRFVGGGREQLSTEKGTVKVENGYLIFEVSSFSEFEVYASSAYMKVINAPSKTVYKYGEEIDLSGIKITYTDDDGTTRTITNASELTVTGYDSSKTGTQTVTVHYGQHSDTFEVKVQLTFWQWLLRIFSFGLLFIG